MYTNSDDSGYKVISAERDGDEDLWASRGRSS